MNYAERTISQDRSFLKGACSFFACFTFLLMIFGAPEHTIASTKSGVEDHSEKKEEKVGEEGKPAAAEGIKNVLSPYQLALIQKEEGITIQVKDTPDLTKIIFPWDEKVAMAAFLRGSNLWVVFDKRNQFKLSPGIEEIKEFEQLSYRSFSVLRIKLPLSPTRNEGEERTYLRVIKEDFYWGVEVFKRPQLLKENSGLSHTIQVITEKAPEKTRVFMPVIRTADPLVFVDSEIGDTVVAIPVFNPGYGTSPTRKFIDFNIERTYQGVVFTNVADSVQYKVRREGVEIGRPQGLNITGNEAVKKEPLPEEKKEAEKEVVMDYGTAFPFNDSYLLNPSQFNTLRQKLQNDIINVPLNDRNHKRLELAKFHFANSFYSNSLGALNDIAMIAPDFANSFEFSMLRYASYFFMRQYAEALRGFLKLDSHEDKAFFARELKLWQWVSAKKFLNQMRLSGVKPEEKELYDALKKAAESIDFEILSVKDAFFKVYPKDLRHEMFLIAAREAINDGKYAYAKDVLNYVVNDRPIGEVRNSAEFMTAEIAAREENYTDALSTWNRISKDVEDRANRTRATFNEARLQLKLGNIDKKEAIKNIESVTFTWRGDEIEMELLAVLGQLYIIEKEYYKGLAIWRQLVNSYPNTEESVFVAGRMRETFASLFDGGAAYDMPPVGALSLYFEFRELTPLGEVGDRIIRQLADHFIKADLLESAAVLLTHQVKYRSTGDERLKLAEKLVQVHLQNKKPQLALDVLDLTESQNISDLFKAPRSYLRVKALTQLQKYEPALAIIKDDKSEQADELRSDIYWNMKDWEKTVDTLKLRFDIRRENPSNLTVRETELLIRLAVAYAVKGDNEILAGLKSDFSKLITSDEDRKTFAFLTKERKPVDHDQFEDTARVDDIQKFLTEYKNRPEANMVQKDEKKPEELPPPEKAVQ